MVLESEQRQIQEVINAFGNDVQIETTAVGTSKDDFGRTIPGTTSSRTIKAVSDNNITNRYNYGSQGALGTADLSLITQGNENFDAKTDKIVFEGRKYHIISIQHLNPADTSFAKILILGAD